MTGGLHLEGFEQLIIEEIGAIGVQNLRVLKNRNATLVGWYRSSKSWDLLVLQDDLPVLSVEYKSMEGSEGKNLNNRADEMFGVAEDAREAEAHGLLPKELRRAYVFIMEATEASTVPVAVGDPIGAPDPIFQGASYLQRMAIMLSRMRDSGLYHLVWALGAVRESLDFVEPDSAVGWDRFAADLRSGFAHGRPVEAPSP